MPFIMLYQPDCLEDTNGKRVWVAGRVEVDEHGHVLVAPVSAAEPSPPASDEQQTVSPVEDGQPAPVASQETVLASQAQSTTIGG